MIVLGIDPASTCGVALAINGVPVAASRCKHTHLDEALTAILAGRTPDRVVIEDPIQQVVGIKNRAGNVQQLRTYRYIRDELIRWFGFRPLVDVPVLTWQARMHDGVIGTPKDRSRAAVKRIMDKALAEGRTDATTVRGLLGMVRDSHDVADAVLIACFGALQKE